MSRAHRNGFREMNAWIDQQIRERSLSADETATMLKVALDARTSTAERSPYNRGATEAVVARLAHIVGDADPACPGSRVVGVVHDCSIIEDRLGFWARCDVPSCTYVSDNPRSPTGRYARKRTAVTAAIRHQGIGSQ